MKKIMPATPEELKRVQGLADEVVSAISLAMSVKLDEAISKAVTMHLGHEAWAPQDLKGRLDRTCYPDGSEEYRLDKKPIVRFGPWKFSPIAGVIGADREITFFKSDDEGLPN